MNSSKSRDIGLCFPLLLPSRWCALSLTLLAASTAYAGVNEIFPNDYYALPPGVVSTTWYYFDRHAEGPYADGRRLLDWSLDSNFLALRITRAFDVSGYRATGLLVASGGALDLDADPAPAGIDTRREGLGDLRIGGTFWPISDDTQRHYLGINALLLPPTGGYAGDQILNIGEHRWRATLSLGWIHGLGERFTLDVTGELAWYGNNDDYQGGKRLNQAPSHAVTAYLRYSAGGRLQLYLGGQYNGCGEAEVDEFETPVYCPNRAYLGANWSVDAENYLNLRLGTDLEADNGFRMQREIALRYVRLFW